jgi:polysaccharide export outer membrane protein
MASLGLLVACAPPPFTWAAEIPAERAKPPTERLRIRQGDVVSINVTGHLQLSGTHTVGSDGGIVLPNIGTVSIGGQAISEAEAELRKRLSLILKNPQVSLTVVNRNIEVTIMGEVARTGKFQLKFGDGVATALALAGGITEFGSENAIFLIRSTEPVRIRFRLKDLLKGGDNERKFSLRDGDLLVVE